jgi:hypothetical protein
MITDIDPYFSARSEFITQTMTRSTPTRHHAVHQGESHLDQRRAERESAFERSYGSLWVPGLLDRLTVPLSRYHE